MPVRSGTIRDEAGNPCLSAEERQQRWRWRFTAVLNQQSHFDVKELAKAEQRPLRAEMAEPPSEEELVKAVSSLKNEKTGRVRDPTRDG